MNLENEVNSHLNDVKTRFRNDLSNLSEILRNPSLTEGIISKIKLGEKDFSDAILEAYSKKGINDLIVELTKLSYPSKAKSSDSENKTFDNNYHNKTYKDIFDEHGLLNAESFKKLISDEESKVLSKKGMTFVAMYFDLNGLKATNDDYDHSAGDEAIYNIHSTLENSACDSIRTVFDERKRERRNREIEGLLTESEKREMNDRRESKGYRITTKESDSEVTRLALRRDSLDSYIDNDYKIERLGGDEFIVVVSCPEDSADNICEEYYSKVKENIESNLTLRKYGITLSAGYSKGIDLKKALQDAEKATKFSKIITGHADNSLVKYSEEVDEYLILSKMMEKSIKLCAAKHSDDIYKRIEEKDLYANNEKEFGLNENIMNFLKNSYITNSNDKRYNLLEVFLHNVNLYRTASIDCDCGIVKLTSKGYADAGSKRLNPGEDLTRCTYKYLEKEKKQEYLEDIMKNLSA